MMFERVVIILAESVDMHRLKSCDDLKELIVQHETSWRRIKQNGSIDTAFDGEGKNSITLPIRRMMELVLC